MRIWVPGSETAASTPVRWLSWVRVRVDVAMWRHGWIWLATTILLFLAAGTWVALTLPLQRRQQALADETRRLERLARTSGSPTAKAPAAVSLSAAGAVARLEEALSERSEVSDQVRRLYEIAAQQQLVITQSAFQHSADTADGIERVQLDIPFKASYPQLRRFMETVLREMPNVSIDQLSFKRGQVSQTYVDAHLRFSIWLKSSGGRQLAEKPNEPLRTEGQP